MTGTATPTPREELRMADLQHRPPDVVSAESSIALRGPDWETEDAYWQSAYPERTYARADRSYEYYRTAYRYGLESALKWRGREWEAAEHALRTGWTSVDDGSRSWEEMKAAVRDAWDRVRGRSTDDRTHIR
jgi:hypothetical protein